MATRTAKALPTGAKPVGRWTILRNLTPRTLVILPEDKSRTDMALVVKPFDVVSLKTSTVEEHFRDTIVQTGAPGKLEVKQDEKRARSMPLMPDGGLGDPNDKQAVAILVYGSDEEAKRIIDLRLERDNGAQDKRYMEETYPKLLFTAIKWLRSWGPPPELAWRVEAMKNRLVADGHKVE